MPVLRIPVMKNIVPQLIVIMLTSFLFAQFRLYKSGKPWKSGPVHFGKMHLPVLALMGSSDVICSLYSQWMAIPAILVGFAVTLVIDR